MTEQRGTGLTPQRLPAEWEKRPLEMTKEPAEGPAKTSRPTSREHIPGAEVRGDSYLGTVMANRPSALYGERAQAPIPTEVIQVIADAPGSFVSQTIAGGSFDAEESGPLAEPVINEGFPGPDAMMVSKKGVKGSTLGKGTI